jgi:hypothetical protein
MAIIIGMSLLCAGARAAGRVPFILKVSDGVSPGSSFSINGEGFFSTSVKVAMALDTTGQPPATPSGGAIYPPILQTDDAPNSSVAAHFVMVRMPAGLTPGVYDIWVANSNGWSAPYKMNAARALYMSDYQAYSNISIEVVGRNFDQSEFGGTTETKARLNDGKGNTYILPVKNISPYHLTFTVGSQPLGTYYVEVSSDNGVNWSRLSSGQMLTVLSTPSGNYDPLGLGVSWASDFNWTNVYNVTNYGVTPNTTNDQTSAIRSVENMAETTGGLVLFPSGSYYCSSISLGAEVVLEGQGASSTKIYYDGSGGSSFIKSRGTSCIGGIPQLQGIANLSIYAASTNTTDWPDVFINLGDTTAGAGTNESLRTANRLFVQGVNLIYPYSYGDSSPSDSRRGIGVQCAGNERFLFQSNYFSGWSANENTTYLNQYCIFRNNYFEYSYGEVIDLASYLFDENNTIKAHCEYNQITHGFAGRNDCYVANNFIEGLGSLDNSQNDGEAIYTEMPNGNFNYGTVLSATSNSLRVSPVVPLTTPVLAYGNLSVVITLGTGMGEMATVSSVDTTTGVISLSQSFPVVPDASSKFVLYAPNANFTVWSNTVVNCAKGIWAYGGQYDGVMADNTTIDCNGLFLFAVRKGPPAYPGMADSRPGMFNRITRNTVIGFSRRSSQAGIGISTGRFDSNNFFDVEVYSTEITDNEILGNNTVAPQKGTEAPPFDGLYISSYYSTLHGGTGTGDATDTIIENNRLSNLPMGITISKCNYGQLVNGNTYDSSVLTFLNDSRGGGDNTLISSNNLVTGRTSPAITMQPQGQSVSINETPTFYVLATGNPAPFYQWYRNNIPITGANSASYTVSPASLGDNGARLSVVVSNPGGSVVSSNAVLTVSNPPVAVDPPQDLHLFSDTGL